MKPLDAAALPLSGIQLIEASAGTGKTYTITSLVLRLLLEKQLRVEQILVVTFTNAATAELRQRIRDRLSRALLLLEEDRAAEDAELAALLARGGDRDRHRELLTDALRNLDEASVFTIHGFCQRALSEFAFESGLRFDLELIADDRPLLREFVRDFWARELHAASPAQLSWLRRSGTRLATFEWLARLAVGWPDLRIEPPAKEVDVLASIEAFTAVRARAAAAWPGCCEEVQRLLTGPALNANKYRASSVESWCQALHEQLSGSAANLDLSLPQIAKFTPTSLAAATKKGQRTPEHAFFGLCDELNQALLSAREALGQWRINLKHQLMRQAPLELKKRKLTRGSLSFDDLLQELHRALGASGGRALAERLRRRYPAALIDEFQDTDPVQYDIFRRIYSDGTGTLLLIGDPKQAIYAFRGADVFAYLRAARDAGQSSWTLAVNYRSDPGLLRALNTVFTRSSEPFLLPEIRYTEVSARPGAHDGLARDGRPAPPFEIVLLDRGEQPRLTKNWAELHLPRLVAARISQLFTGATTIEGRAVRPGDVAVLTRTNRGALAIQRELRVLGIPSVLHGDSSVLESAEAVELGYVLRALADPTRRTAIRAALATSLFGVSAEQLYRLSEDEAAWDAWVEKFQRWHVEWNVRGFVQAFRALMRDEQVIVRLLRTLGGERKLTNLQHLSELLHQASREHHLGISGLLQWYDEVRFDEESRDTMAPESMQIRLESDAAAVQLTTMHRSKGLEYPIVFCPYLWDGTVLRGLDKTYCRYHDEDTGQLVLDLKPEQPATDLATREARAENLRLAYVALTRAKRFCAVFWGAFKEYEESPLAHLLHAGAGESGSVGERLRTADDAVLAADLEQLSRLSDGAIRVSLCDPTQPDPRPYRAEAVETPRARARVRAHEFGRVRRTSSFSALAAAEKRLSMPAELGLDYDDRALPGALARAPAERVPLADFPRGAKAGEALHTILEHLDFVQREPEAERTLIRRALGQHGIGPEWDVVVQRALADVLETPLDDGSRRFTLDRIARTERLNELEFVFPVALGATRRNVGLVTGDLVRAFTAHARHPVPEGYADALGRLGFEPLVGFLRGYIDLVCEFDGRYYVLDYKSNYLGPSPEDYDLDSLRASMLEHHYVLQYHLYSLALHRYLRVRLPGYRYERDFGGIFYLYLRGMPGSAGGPRGVYFDKPSAELLTALSEAVGGEP